MAELKAACRPATSKCPRCDLAERRVYALVSGTKGDFAIVTSWPDAALALVGGYLLGSIPFGVILTRIGRAGDLRAIGSGNIGATNVLRTGRKGLAALTLLLDGAKGGVAVLVALALAPAMAPIAATGAFLGHLYPAWLRFRGGKGVATMLGIALALQWPCGLVFAGTWLLMLALTRISSVAGMSAAVAAPVCAAWFGAFDLCLLLLALGLLVLFKHRANIERLLDGTEPRIGRARTPDPLG